MTNISYHEWGEEIRKNEILMVKKGEKNFKGSIPVHCYGVGGAGGNCGADVSMVIE